MAFCWPNNVVCLSFLTILTDASNTKTNHSHKLHNLFCCPARLYFGNVLCQQNRLQQCSIIAPKTKFSLYEMQEQVQDYKNIKTVFVISLSQTSQSFYFLSLCVFFACQKNQPSVDVGTKNLFSATRLKKMNCTLSCFFRPGLEQHKPRGSDLR